MERYLVGFRKAGLVTPVADAVTCPGDAMLSGRHQLSEELFFYET